MRRSKEDAAESRRKIVAAASRRFRERGPQGVSVSEIMSEAGMTHGGFYKHFKSKDALLAAAIEETFAEQLALLGSPSGQDAAASLGAYVSRYLSQGHVGSLGAGCPIAGMTIDGLREGDSAMAAVAKGAEAILASLANANGGGSGGEKRAIAQLSMMIGAVQLARALAQPERQDAVLAVAREAITP